MKKNLIFPSLVLYTAITTFTMEKEHQNRKDFHWHSMDDIDNNDTTSASSSTQSSYAKSGVYPAVSDEALPALCSLGERVAKSEAVEGKGKQEIPHDKLKEFADQLNAAINKRCTGKDFFGYEYQLESSKLKEKDFFDIIQIIDEYSKTYNFTLNNFIETFNYISQHPWYCSDTKYYINRTMLYFIGLAKKNFDGVTSATLDIVYDPDSLQTTPQLNRLPKYLKIYCMQNAYLKEINQSYDIVLAGHTDTIHCVAVHEATHRAATSDYHGTLRVWDLTTGKCINMLAIANSFNCITFNNDGSLIANASKLGNESSCISIYDPQSTRPNTPLCVKEVKIPTIYSLSYKNKTLIACSNDNPPKISIFSVKNNTIKEKEEMIELPQLSRTRSQYQTWGNYSAIHPINSFSYNATIAITKKNCQNFCIYQQAIKNDALNFDVEKIEATPFNEYEKGILHKLLISEQSKQKI